MAIGRGSSIRKTRCVQFEFGGCNLDTRASFQTSHHFLARHRFDPYRITSIGPMPISKYREP
jgi:hypothetical protein